MKQPIPGDVALEEQHSPTKVAEPIEPPLTPGLFAFTDIQEYAKYTITSELMERAKAGRISDYEARTHYHINHSGNNSGVIFKYYDLNGTYLTARLDVIRMSTGQSTP